ncbi:MAG: hypothetical protein ACE5FO_14085 [Parvularculaceae bacterium]
MKRFLTAVGLLALPLFANGCVVAAAAGAGYLIHDEATENDGKFDPLEDVRGEGDGKN